MSFGMAMLAYFVLEFLDDARKARARVSRVGENIDLSQEGALPGWGLQRLSLTTVSTMRTLLCYLASFPE
jgi:predicted hotdog family 3-hydroxylacyl-ACP dehydratase